MTGTPSADAHPDRSDVTRRGDGTASTDDAPHRNAGQGDGGGGRAVVVAGSARQLARALGNLVDNAARHAAGAVRIGLDHDAGAREARLVVDDDGPGIPPADRERVFERFTRLDDGRARHDGGSGLGLAVVRSIAAAHHGTVHATRSPLGGARFVVTLPAEP